MATNLEANATEHTGSVRVRALPCTSAADTDRPQNAVDFSAFKECVKARISPPNTVMKNGESVRVETFQIAGTLPFYFQHGFGLRLSNGVRLQIC
jgi:hypothetical protein